MKRKILVWLKRPFLLVFWFIKRTVVRIKGIGNKLSRNRKKVYETHIQELLKFRYNSPLNHLSVPPWSIHIVGACLILGKYVSSQIFHAARSNRYMEIMGFVLGKRFGELFIGITFVEITNALHSSIAALPDYEHVAELKREVTSRYPELEVVAAIHSHPNGIIRPSQKDEIAFLLDSHPNIIVSPLTLFWGSPIERMAAYYHSHCKVRKIRLFEIDKKEVELKDIDIKELVPSKEELLNVGELATEIDFGIYKIWLVSHPNLTLKKLGNKLSELFGEKIRFVFLYKEADFGWIYIPGMKVVDFFLQDGDHLVFPESFEEVKR